MKNRIVLSAALLFIIGSSPVSRPASADRISIDLSGYDWGLYRDFDAEWTGDDIYLPPVDVAVLPVSPPTCGWDGLTAAVEKTVHLPATVEEHFWGDNGTTEGVGGDYRGVSWWITTLTLGPEIRGKRVFLDFESVHLRAEVFVNRSLVGYDVIGHTPFSVDITDDARIGDNEIAVRITDPLGNFDWNDRRVMKWGRHDVPSCHGFGGITGRVFLRAVDPVYIDDIHVMNKPSIREVDAVLSIANLTGGPVDGTITVRVYPRINPEETIWKKDFRRKIDATGSELTVTVKARKAEIWDLDNPALYVAEAVFVSADGAYRDSAVQRFGFRWFDIGEKNGDMRLYLNGRRIVLRGGMSWGFWPVNGVYPTREMAERDVSTAKALGLTYMNFHRAIGQPAAMDAADVMGFLTYEEPGGYSCEGADPNATLWRDWRREKLLRMVKRDRSRPSLIIYNLQNRTPNPLSDEDLRNMRDAHALDPARILTFISGFWKEPPKESPDKLFFRPYDFTEYYTGWFDMHHGLAEPGYTDAFYNAPDDYLRHTGIRDEVVFWGEDGGIFSPPRLQLIRDYYNRTGEPFGWQGRRFIQWYEAFDDFLDRNGFREFFHDIDAFTKTMGNTTLHYHGRIIENIRVGNLDDCYTINGWAAPHLSNQAEVADLYRNPVGDPDVMAYYCRPLYVAVKLRDRVAPTGSTVTADIYLVNEANLKGPHELAVSLVDERGRKLFGETYNVNITGGEEYGQLLAEGINLTLGDTPGYQTVEAVLRDRGGAIRADGRDEAYAIDLPVDDISRNGAVADTSGAVNRFLGSVCGFTLPDYSGDTGNLNYIVVGPTGIINANRTAALMERVANGAVAVVVSDAGRFAEMLTSETMEAVDYRGQFNAVRGKFVAGKHELLDGLPQGKAFDWEHQIFYRNPRRNISAMKLYGVKTLVAAVSDNQKEAGTALTVVPYGRGAFVLSTLAVLPFLEDKTPQSIAAKRLFLNYLRYAGKRR